MAASNRTLGKWNTDRMNDIAKNLGLIQGNTATIDGFIEEFRTANADRVTNENTASGDIQNLKDWNQDRIKEIQGINTRTDANWNLIEGLKTRLDEWDTDTQTGEVISLEDRLKTLTEKYTGDAETEGSFANLLGTSGFMKESNFDTRMSQNLESLGLTLDDDGITNIGGLDIGAVTKALSDEEGNLLNLTDKFAGLDTKLSNLNNLSTEDVASQIQTELSGLDTLSDQDVQDLINTSVGDDLTGLLSGDLTDENSLAYKLKNLQDTIGTDRTADIRDHLKDALSEDGSIKSAIEKEAFSIRDDYGKEIFDLSKTFQGKHDTLKDTLGSDIKDLFGTTEGLTKGVDVLTSGLDTTSQQLEALQGSFGDYKETAATNLGNVKEAFAKQIGDQGTDFTKQLGDLESSTAQDILGLRGDVASDRATALSELDTTWSGKLQAQDTRLQEQFDAGSEALQKRLSDISSSMNYRTLGDSAEGVKIRRSKAYNQGRTRSGTGQLGRSMKISTLNI
jgi:uncharacterized protein YukE